MGPYDIVLFLIQHQADLMSKQVDRLINDQVGITMSQYRVLMALDWNPRMTQKRIAASLGQTEAAISRQISILEKNDYVKFADQKNKRNHVIITTTKGQQALELSSNLIKNYFLNNGIGSHMNSLKDILLIDHKNLCKKGKIGACNHTLII